MTVHLTTFASPDMERSAQLCVDSAARHGVNTFTYFTPKFIGHWKEVESNAFLFNERRGLGFWAWKPLIIHREMRNADEGSIIIYSDAGVEFIDNINYIIDRMDQDIFLFGNMYDHAHWCKRDIVEAIWPSAKTVTAKSEFASVVYDVVEFDEWLTWSRFGKQVQASVIFFRVNDKTKAFVAEWLKWCLFDNGSLIDDSPSWYVNHPEFQENRHDQAILTTMAYRDGYKLHWWPAQYNDGAFTYPRGDYPDEGYPVMFHHHRRRNSDWEAAA